MKNVLSAILILFLFLSCQSPNTDRIPVEFQIQTFDVANSRMEVVFSITNPTQTVWEGGAWSLHWNSIYGVVDSESLPQGIQFTYVDGQHYQYLEFGADFSLPPDETLTLPVSIKGIVNRLVMGPGGFFVHNHKTQKNIDLKNNAEALCYEANKQLLAVKDSISSEKQETITKLIENIKKDLESENFDLVTNQLEELKVAMQELLEITNATNNQ